MNRIEIKKGLFGRLSVGYDCPHCRAPLKSPLDDAGKSDQCPDCGTRLIVPGTQERDRIQAENEAAAQKRIEEKALAQQRDLRQRELLRLNSMSRPISESPPPVAVVVPSAPTPNDDAIHCPRCGSSQLASNKKGFGLGKAAAGAILLGPVGLLGGIIGGNKVRITCLKCGNVFEPGQGV
jgi:tellurium resistance protein TerD